MCFGNFKYSVDLVLRLVYSIVSSYSMLLSTNINFVQTCLNDL